MQRVIEEREEKPKRHHFEEGCDNAPCSVAPLDGVQQPLLSNGCKVPADVHCIGERNDLVSCHEIIRKVDGPGEGVDDGRDMDVELVSWVVALA